MPADPDRTGAAGSRQGDGTLVMKPGVEAFLRFLVITAPIEIDDHHAGFVAISAVGERTHARESPLGIRLAFTIDKEMHRV